MQRTTCENRHDGKKCTIVTALRLVSLARVSSKKQLRDGEGAETQHRTNREYIERQEHKWVKDITIAESASIGYKERYDMEAAMNELIEMKREGRIDGVVLYNSDRLSRGEGGEYFMIKALLVSHGIRVLFSTQQIDDTPSGELLEYVMAGIGRFDNRVRTDRTISAEMLLTQEGYWCRPAPTGFVNGREGDSVKGKPVLKPITDTSQWELLAYGLRKQMTGLYKITEVAAELRSKGFITREYHGKDGTLKGKNPLSAQTWYKICRSPVYGGLIGGKWVTGDPIRAKFDGAITPEEWWSLQAVLDGRKTGLMKVTRKAIHPDFPLRRTLLCPCCGEFARGSRGKGKMGKYYYYYHCKNKACRFNVQTKEIHALFEGLLQKIAPSPELIRLFKETVLDAWATKYRQRNQEVITTQKEVVLLEQEKGKLVELMKNSYDNPELLTQLKEEFSEISRKCTALKARRTEHESEEVKAEVVVDYCMQFLLNAHKLWKEARVEEQKRYQSMIFPEGVSYNVLTGRQTPKLSPVYDAIPTAHDGDSLLAAPRRIELRLTD